MRSTLILYISLSFVVVVGLLNFLLGKFPNNRGQEKSETAVRKKKYSIDLVQFKQLTILFQKVISEPLHANKSKTVPHFEKYNHSIITV